MPKGETSKSEENSKAWFGVRLIIQNDRSFEDRVTIWNCSSPEAALILAEAEAERYIRDVISQESDPRQLLGFSDVFSIDGPPQNGTEVFWAQRETDLSGEEYLNLLFGPRVDDSGDDEPDDR
jgi:hypothetical protein